MFGQPADDKARLIEALERALGDLREGRIALRGTPVFVTAPQAFDANLTSDKTANFFGFSFVYQAEPKRPAPPPTKTTENPPQTPLTSPPPYESPTMKHVMKCNEREVELLRQGIDYVCPCGFKTDSSTGMKKHANRCQAWLAKYRPAL